MKNVHLNSFTIYFNLTKRKKNYFKNSFFQKLVLSKGNVFLRWIYSYEFKNSTILYLLIINFSIMIHPFCPGHKENVPTYIIYFFTDKSELETIYFEIEKKGYL